MNELIEIISIVKSGKITRPDQINPFNKVSEHTSREFYKGLMAGSYTSDDEAREALYGKSKGRKAGTSTRNKYNVLKKRVKDRIFTAVLFPARGRYSPNSYADAFIYCYRNFTIGRMLLFFGARVAGQRLLEKVLARAREFEIYDIAMPCVLALRRELVIKGDPKILEGFKKDLKEFREKMDAEAEIEGIYYDLELPFATKLYISPETVQAVANGLIKAKRIAKNCPTFRAQNLVFDIKILDYQVCGALMTAARTCDKAIAFLKTNKKMHSKAREGILLMKKLDCLIMVDETDKAYRCANECLETFMPGIYNWYITKELLFLAQVNDPLLPLEKAICTYTDCIRHPKFKALERPDQEKWHILGGYLWFMLTYHNKIAGREAVFGKGKVFDLAALSNKIATTKKDKKGIFVSFTILKALVYIIERQPKNIESSTENLKNYLSLNLRGDNGRGRNFIKLLLALIEDEGKLHTNTQLINRLSRKLEQSEPMVTATQFQIEIISYSKLWKMAEGIIKKYPDKEASVAGHL